MLDAENGGSREGNSSTSWKKKGINWQPQVERKVVGKPAGK